MRFADLNKEPGAAFDVMVSSRRAYYVRSQRPDRERGRGARAGERRVEVATLPWHARAIAARGALDATFRNDLIECPTAAASTTASSPPRAICRSRRAAAARHVRRRGARVAREPRHRLSVRLLLSAQPVRRHRLSSGVDLRYAYRFWRVSRRRHRRRSSATARGTLGRLWRTARDGHARAPSSDPPLARPAPRHRDRLAALSGTVSSAASTLTGSRAARPSLRARRRRKRQSRRASSASSPAAAWPSMASIRKAAQSALSPNGFLNVGVQFSL